jgi:predicted RNase H-like HicB family nuclease
VLTLINAILAWALDLQNAFQEAPGARALTTLAMPELKYKIESGQEEGGRWIAAVVELPGARAYGSSQQEAIAGAEVIAFRVIADRIDETKVATSRVSFDVPA